MITRRGIMSEIPCIDCITFAVCFSKIKTIRDEYIEDGRVVPTKDYIRENAYYWFVYDFYTILTDCELYDKYTEEVEDDKKELFRRERVTEKLYGELFPKYVIEPE